MLVHHVYEVLLPILDFRPRLPIIDDFAGPVDAGDLRQRSAAQNRERRPSIVAVGIRRVGEHVGSTFVCSKDLVVLVPNGRVQIEGFLSGYCVRVTDGKPSRVMGIFSHNYHEEVRPEEIAIGVISRWKQGTVDGPADDEFLVVGPFDESVPHGRKIRVHGSPRLSDFLASGLVFIPIGLLALFALRASD